MRSEVIKKRVCDILGSFKYINLSISVPLLLLLLRLQSVVILITDGYGDDHIWMRLLLVVTAKGPLLLGVKTIGGLPDTLQRPI